MIPVDQKVLTVPGGDCFSACVASLLELPLEAVPYFMGDGPVNEPSKWFDDFLAWLAKFEYWAVAFELRSAWKPLGLCIMSGKSPRGDYDHRQRRGRHSQEVCLRCSLSEQHVQSGSGSCWEGW